MVWKIPQFVKLSLLVLCLPTVLLIFAPMARAQTSAFESQSGEISGTVLLEADHRPAGGVIVNVKSLSGGPFASVLTDFSGRFEVRGLPPGTYEITADEPGFESARVTAQLNAIAPGLVLYLRSPNPSPASRMRHMISVRELKIPGKALEAFKKGMQSLIRNDNAGSLAHFTKATAAFPDYYEAYYHAGVAEMRLGHDDEAKQAFQKAIDLSGGRFAYAEFGLGALLCRRGENGEAETVIRKGLEADDSSPVGRFNLGVALLGLNRLDEAEKSAHEALLRDPGYAKAYLLLSDVHARKGNYRAQAEDLEAYLKLEPAGPTSDRARQVREAAQRLASESTP